MIDSLPSVLGVTARKLERWRQAGLIPATTQTRGGVRGSASSYPPETAAQVAELSRILKSEDSLDHAMLRLFMRRYPVRLKSLKTLYLDLFAALSRLDSLQAPDGSRASRSGLARTVRFRLRKLASPRETADVLMHGVFAQVLEVFRSGDLSLEWDYNGSQTAELKHATGIALAETDAIHQGRTLLPEVATGELERSLSLVSHRGLEAALRRATLPALERARDQWRHVLALLADLGELTSSPAGHRRDVAGLEAVRKLARDEVLTALFVPFWLGAREMMKRAGIEIAPLWDPATPEGSEHAEFFSLLARLARSTSLPVSSETLAEALQTAPAELRAEFDSWLERAPERTVLV